MDRNHHRLVAREVRQNCAPLPHYHHDHPGIMTIQAGDHTVAAADPVPMDLSGALDAVRQLSNETKSSQVRTHTTTPELTS